MADLYPFAPRHLQLDAGRMHYLDEGEGSPIVFVHGNPSWSFYYRELILALRGRFRCIAPDHIGCGLSDKPDDANYRYTLDQRIADLEALIDSTVKDQKLTLVLHDWGGAIGMGWAVQHPEQVERIILLNTGAFRNPKGQGLPFTVWLARDTVLGAILVQGCNAFALGAALLGVRRRMSAAIRRGYTSPYDSWTNRRATLRFVQDIPLGPEDPAWTPLLRTEEGLSAFKDTPVLICWGEKDFVFDSAFLAEWEKRWPHAKVHRFPNGGHYVLEDETEAITAHVSDFLNSKPMDAAP